jgi:hypothetical protein
MLKRSLKLLPCFKNSLSKILSWRHEILTPIVVLVKVGLVVYKAWIEENVTDPVKPGSVIPVAIKTLNHNGYHIMAY